MFFMHSVELFLMTSWPESFQDHWSLQPKDFLPKNTPIYKESFGLQRIPLLFQILISLAPLNVSCCQGEWDFSLR